MADGELAEIIDAARDAVKGREIMVSDGNVQEELARAFERHALRLESASKDLQKVGAQNYLGPTVEGEAATYNIQVGVVTHERSLFNTFNAQAAEARGIARALRENGRRILRAEGANEAEINAVIGGN
ncbi:hypothetical protein GCM10009551_097010 [Nocardiopsis tropica]|uniref:hypothetical protein n=1 Tax=Tsukamurella strandjordii TaxID=147577 RepID=UPI0031DDAF2C